MKKVKRSEFATFLNTGTTASPTWSLMGNGITSQVVNYNPQTSEEVYIHEDAGTVDVTSYKPAIETPQTAYAGDAVFDYIDEIRRSRKTGTSARSEIVLVYLYDDAVGGEYPAEHCACSVQIDDFGGEGGGSLEINYTINMVGDPVMGKFDPATKSFTEGA